MAYEINDECVNCGVCETECPVEGCITQGDDKYVINAETCESCDACFNVCPAGAVVKI